jgi:hypothetical protein
MFLAFIPDTAAATAEPSATGPQTARDEVASTIVWAPLTGCRSGRRRSLSWGPLGECWISSDSVTQRGRLTAFDGLLPILSTRPACPPRSRRPVGA